MPLTHDQVVSSLIAYYKRNGADLTYLLGDPTFQSLPLEARVEAVKSHAKTILAHSSNSLTSSEKAQIKAQALMSGIGGLAATATLASAVLPKLGGSAATLGALRTAGLAGVAGGVLTGLAVGKLMTSRSQEARTALRSELQRVEKDPNLDNAIGVFSVAGHHARETAFRDVLRDRALSRISASHQEGLPGKLDQIFQSSYSDRMAAHPAASMFPAISHN